MHLGCEHTRYSYHFTILQKVMCAHKILGTIKRSLFTAELTQELLVLLNLCADVYLSWALLLLLLLACPCWCAIGHPFNFVYWLQPEKNAASLAEINTSDPRPVQDPDTFSHLWTASHWCESEVTAMERRRIDYSGFWVEKNPKPVTTLGPHYHW